VDRTFRAAFTGYARSNKENSTPAGDGFSSNRQRMNQTATRSRESAKARAPHTGATGAAEMPRPAGEQQHDESGKRGSVLFAPLRWLGRKLSGLVRWVAKRLQAPLRAHAALAGSAPAAATETARRPI
jgi:hypothetical protein